MTSRTIRQFMKKFKGLWPPGKCEISCMIGMSVARAYLFPRYVSGTSFHGYAIEIERGEVSINDLAIS